MVRSILARTILFALLTTIMFMMSLLPESITIINEADKPKGLTLQAASGPEILSRPRTSNHLVREGHNFTWASLPSTSNGNWHDKWLPYRLGPGNSSLKEFSEAQGRLPPEPKPLTPKPNDWIVTGKEVRENEIIVLTGNLIIKSGGDLTLINCTLLMNCSYNGEWQIKVESGGKLNILKGSVITAYNPNYEFSFYVYHGHLFMRESELHRCGGPDYGLWIHGGEATIEKCKISNCHYGVIITDVRVTITNCKIYNNTIGIKCYDSDNANIINCEIYDNRLTGIYLFDWAWNTAIIGCDIHDNHYGLLCYLHGCSSTKIIGCKIYDNDCGIYCEVLSCTINVHYCNIYSNEGPGLRLDQADGLVNVTYCWWGDAAGPEYGVGDPEDPEEISGPEECIVYEPWLDEPWVDTTPPHVTIITPTEGSYVHGLIDVRAEASDDIAVNYVQFYINGTLFFTDYSSPFICAWNTTIWPDGTYTINVTAYDIHNNTDCDVTIVVVDNTAPVGVIMSPAHRTYIRGRTFINITASDENLYRIELYINNTLVATWAENGVYIYAWNTTAWPDGLYEVELIVRDKAGNLAEAKVLVIVDNTPPEGQIMKPVNGSFVSGLLSVEIMGFDVNLRLIKLYVDDVLVATWAESGTHTYLLNTTTIKDGPHRIKLLVEDLAGNIHEEEIIITVDNTPPEGAILAPEEGAYLRGTVEIKVSGADKNLQAVELYVDDALLSSWIANGTYSYEWDTTAWPDGTHVLKLIITDKAGNRHEVSITITVDNTLPSAQIISPSEGSYVNGVIQINITGRDENLKILELYIDDELIASWTASGTYTYVWDTTTRSDGVHTIRLVVYDLAGNEAEKSVSITVDNTPPVISSVEQDPEVPSEGEEVTVIASVSDAISGLESVILYYRVNGGEWRTVEMTCSEGAWVATIPGQEAGASVEYYVEARDKAGNTAKSDTYTYEVKAVAAPGPGPGPTAPSMSWQTITIAGGVAVAALVAIFVMRVIKKRG